MDEPTTTEIEENPETPIRIGPATCFVVATILGTDAVFAWAQLDYSLASETTLVGLAFGQVGAAVIWAMAPGKVRRWKKGLAAFATAAAVGGWMSITMPSHSGTAAVALFVTIFLAHAALTMLLIGGWQLAKSLRRRGVESTNADSLPRFGVKHLLGAMTLLAISSTIVRVALPELVTNATAIVVFVAQNALLALFASEFLLPWRSKFWGFSALLLSAIVLTIFAGWLMGDYEEYAYVNAVQVAVLAFAVGLPQLDSRTAWRSG